MKNQMLHVFRNTPFGRETLMQSALYAQRADLELSIYVPKHPQFLIYFDRNIATIDLDRSFLRAAATARDHAEEIMAPFGLPHGFFSPTKFTASTLPEIPATFGSMCCPRTISDLSSKVGLGYIGPRIRGIVRHAAFPVLIPASVCKEWKSVVCFFGGSRNSIQALACALSLSGTSGLPLTVMTQAEGRPQETYRRALQERDLLKRLESGRVDWVFFEGGPFRENIYAVPHDALVVVGAYGHGVARDLMFGSKMESIQTILPNPLVIVGPHYSDS